MTADTPLDAQALSPRTGLPTSLWAAFALSGVAGLVYELVWTRYLALLVGHSAYAQILVLVVYLGGTALGSLAVAARSKSVARPLLGYALVEALLGGLGLSFHLLYRGGSSLLYTVVVPAVGEAGASLATWAVAVSLILPQAVLLGATFPLMAAGIVRRVPDAPGRSIANIYLLNTLGGAVGILLGGFVVIPAVGMPGAAVVAGLLNLGAAALAARAERSVTEAAPALQAAGTATEIRENSPAIRLLLLGTGLSALASFLYEIGWIRMLSLVMGSATHSFELMLSAFLVGLGLGSAAIRHWADRDEAPLRLVGRVQWAMGVAALLTVPIYAQCFDLMAWLIGKLPQTDSGYQLFNAARYGIALIVMLPATLLAGTTLPLFVAALLRRRADERAIGRAYGVNTFGSMVGAVLGGLVFLPRLGLEGLLALGGALDMAVGVGLLAAAAAPGKRLKTGAAAAGLAAVLVFGVTRFVELDRTVLTSGVYRTGTVPDSANAPEMLFYRDAATATVSVQRYKSGQIAISTNGKPDASLPARWIQQAGGEAVPIRAMTGSDESTQVLGPLILLAHNRNARRAGVIGNGSGMSGQTLLGSPRIDSLITIEIEPAMIEGARLFHPANRRPYEDPRARFLLDDARSALASSTDRYDLIFSEPSNPWVSGVASLFTVQFYERVRDRLAPGGVFGQWFHLYEMEDRLLLSVLAAIDDSFTDWSAWEVGTGDVLIVAGVDSLPPPDWTVTEDPGIASELSHAPRLSAGELESLFLFDGRLMGPLLADWPRNTDFQPILDEGAERARFLKHAATGIFSFGNESLTLQRILTGEKLSALPIDTLAITGLPSWGRAIAGWLATTAFTDSTPSVLQDGDRRRQRSRELVEDHSVAGVDQSNWGRWAAAFALVEANHHAGTAGWVDTTFYRKIDAYIASVPAPEDIRASVALMRALRVLDFAAAAAAADRMGAIGAGRMDDARAAYRVLAPRVPEPFGVRSLMLGTLVGAPPPGS